MELEELIGRKVVRTEPVIIESDEGKDEDDSYLDVKKEYITIIEKKDNKIFYIQHFGRITGERYFDLDSKYDQLFLDDNWVEFIED